MNFAPSVYVITQADRSSGRTTPEVVSAAVEAGADAVQLREKRRTARDRYEVGRTVREITAAAGVPLIANDRADLAAALDADGVHLGDDDLPVAAARDVLGEAATVGRSVSTVADAERAAAAGADYLGAGAVFPTDTKPVEGTVGVERVRAISDVVSLPVVAIGGIDADNAADAVAAGADGVAVVSAVTAADDPGAATRDLAAAVERGRAADGDGDEDVA